MISFIPLELHTNSENGFISEETKFRDSKWISPNPGGDFFFSHTAF